MTKRILALSVLLNIGLFQGIAFADPIAMATESGMPRHMAIVIPIPNCPPGYTWNYFQYICTR